MCTQQLSIPPNLPDILKEYSKAAIRTQPYNILQWSASYFRAKASGDIPPVKERLEFPPIVTSSGLTPEYLKLLIKKFGSSETVTVPKEALTEQWKNLCLQEDKLNEIFDWNPTDTVDWPKFVALAAGYIGKSLTETMVLLCKLFSKDGDCDFPKIPASLFCDLYSFLANLDAGPVSSQIEESTKNETGTSTNSKKHEVPGIGPQVPSEQITDVVQYVMQKARMQEDMIRPEIFLDFSCPPLDAL